MKSDDVWDKLLDLLYCNLWVRLIEHLHSIAVLSWRVHNGNTASGLTEGVDCVHDIGILEDDQVQFGLENPPQHWLNSSVPDISYIISPELDRCLCFVPYLYLILPTFRSPHSTANLRPLSPHTMPSPTHDGLSVAHIPCPIYGNYGVINLFSSW